MAQPTMGEASSKARTQVTVEVVDNTLNLCGTAITFMRTLRIPDDGKDYPLPPGLGSFPIRRVSDYADKVPESWRTHAGVFLPIYQREAMWLSFNGNHWKPNAVKVAIGKVCALTGKPWSEELHSDKQDYMVVPGQPWLDGINSGDGTIRQFVAMPLGLGYTVEGQVTGEETHGGLQLAVFEPKPGTFKDRQEQPFGIRRSALAIEACCYSSVPMSLKQASPVVEMGLAAGGKMRQEIYADSYGVGVWDQSTYARVFVHLCNSVMWRDITGEDPPETPATAQKYAEHNLPWFELYDEGKVRIDASDVLAGVKSVKEMDEAKGLAPQQDDSSVSAKNIIVEGLDGKW